MGGKGTAFVSNKEVNEVITSLNTKAVFNPRLKDKNKFSMEEPCADNHFNSLHLRPKNKTKTK
ncbi:hypothetical protein [uncultured Bacteroides sp.]|uniref:hypothetical protein n=1 Tax=uncultured Bacteroides sp. TaxID=162156 RepID=UPI0025F90145|nr:hypothetical protein [uncultured Bacteroides sp.]